MNRGLGRGLASLIPNEPVNEKTAGIASEHVTMLPIDKLKPNRHQPRHHFDADKLNELAQSIKEHGLQQPLLVTPSRIPGEYELIAGERRLRACKLLGKTEIPVIVRDVTDKQSFHIAIIENIQRHDLNPVEEAKAYKKLRDEFGHTQEDLARILGKDRSVVANTIRLLQLPQEVQEFITSGQLSAGHGRMLAGLADAKQQQELAARIIADKLTVRDIEKLVSQSKMSSKTKAAKKALPKIDAELKQLCDELQVRLGTKVKVMGKPSKGRIEVHYFSLKELERIVEYLRKTTK
jgi:ParB family chromosome partitioning protein